MLLSTYLQRSKLSHTHTHTHTHTHSVRQLRSSYTDNTNNLKMAKSSPPRNPQTDKTKFSHRLQCIKLQVILDKFPSQNASTKLTKKLGYRPTSPSTCGRSSSEWRETRECFAPCFGIHHGTRKTRSGQKWIQHVSFCCMLIVPV